MNFVFEKIDGEHHLNFINCPDVNPSGIRRFTPSPVVTTMIRYWENKEKFDNIDLTKLRISTNPNDFDTYIIPSGVTHSPYDWCGLDSKGNGVSFGMQVKNVFSYLNETYLRDLRSGRAVLLLDQSHEGYQYNWVFDWFHTSCNDYNINPKQIMYVTGDLEVDIKYQQYCIDNQITDKLTMIGYPHFECAVHTNGVNRIRIFSLNKLPDVDDHIKYKKKRLEKIKTYNCLQKRPRAHRIWMFKELYENNLLNDGINSMNYLEFENTYYCDKHMSKEEFEPISKLLPMAPPSSLFAGKKELQHFEQEDSGKYYHQFNEDIMLDTWISVISEASFGEEQCFISEKTFKPIMAYHPFIVFGNKNSMLRLRELGYKTFHPYIDESYDELETWERLDAIIKAIEKVKQIPVDEKLKWFEGMREILEHNADTLRRNSVVNVPEVMVKISKCFED